MAGIDKNDYTKWLASEIQSYTSYHNHKETMAWVITALYVPGIIYLGYMLGTIWRGVCLELLASVLIFLFGVLVGVFVNMQFSMRWLAADGVKALRELWARFYYGGEFPRQDEWLFNTDKDTWPYLVQTKVCELRQKRKRNCKEAFGILPKLFLFWLWDKDKHDNRWKTELSSYLAIFGATLISLLLIWN